VKQSSSPPSTSSAAFFDMDGTLVDCNIVEYYVYIRTRMMSPVRAALWKKAYLIKCLGYLLLDRIDRTRFNLAFYDDYRGLPAEEIKALAADCYRDVIRPRCFQQVAACLQQHRDAGREPVLVTGSLDFLVRPLVEDLRMDHAIAATLVESDGRFTGELSTAPIGQEEKARRVREFAAQHRIDLARSFAYGDSLADLPMLDLVGHANVVNPDRRLSRLAKSRNWIVHRWTRA